MSDEKRVKKTHVEVASQQLHDELIAIKDRLNAIESIQSIANRDSVKGYVADFLKTQNSKDIMRECEYPRSKDDLAKKLGHNSTQALDRYLQPLKRADLLRREVGEDGTIVFDWSNLFRRLPKSTIKSLLEEK